ncbi:MAG: phosphatase PAP2 family protein [Cypionkella sp.]
MQTLDTALFLWLTASLQSPGWIVALATALASYVVPLVVVALVLAFVRARPGWRPALLDAVASGALGLALVQVISALHYRPRPFEAGLGANLLNHVPENSFPSDHATLMFALAFALLASQPLRRAGGVLLALAVAVSWARVYLGVHYPSDLLGGAILALLCVALVHFLAARFGVWRLAIGVYEGALRQLHLPQRLFPRGL